MYNLDDPKNKSGEWNCMKCVYVCRRQQSAQEWKNHSLVGHERVDILVLAGSESIFTDITEYTYFSLI